MDKNIFDTRELRGALGHFATGVTIVTTTASNGQPVGMTASSFNTVSLDPPLVLWSVGRQAHGYAAFAEAKHFAIHVLHAGQKELSTIFGSAGNDKFSTVDIRKGLHGLPLLDEYAVCFECSMEHRYEGGDHLILVGRILRINTDSSLKPPLLFYRGGYAELCE